MESQPMGDAQVLGQPRSGAGLTALAPHQQWANLYSVPPVEDTQGAVDLVQWIPGGDAELWSRAPQCVYKGGTQMMAVRGIASPGTGDSACPVKFMQHAGVVPVTLHHNDTTAAVLDRIACPKSMDYIWYPDEGLTLHWHAGVGWSFSSPQTTGLHSQHVSLAQHEFGFAPGGTNAWAFNDITYLTPTTGSHWIGGIALPWEIPGKNAQLDITIIRRFINWGTNGFLFQNEQQSASPVRRIRTSTGSDLLSTQNSQFEVMYDIHVSRWRVRPI